jgi:hypothetical protein
MCLLLRYTVFFPLQILLLLEVLRFELRALCSVDKHCTLEYLFDFVIFQIGSCVYAQASLILLFTLPTQLG